MEEKLWELESIPSANPLFSTIITFCTLILLYFPYIFLQIVFSPVLISTSILLLVLLRLGANQKAGNDNPPEEPIESKSTNEDHKWVEPEIEPAIDRNPLFVDTFVEWNVRAPLEVIYEEYEGEEEEVDQNEKDDTRFMGLERYPSLSLYYPESDTESSSDGEFSSVGDWDSQENMCFRWDEEDREELIEIALDGKKGSEFHSEEDNDNMIEIDLSPGIKFEFSGEM